MFVLNQHCKNDRWTIWTKSSQQIGWSKIRRRSKRILGGRSNSICWLNRVSLKRYQICQPRSPCYASNENEKKRKYNNRVINVEQGCFMPLAFSAKGGMGHECKTFYSVLAEMITMQWKQEYCITMSWLRRKFSFLLMRSVLLCVRGSSSKNVNQEEINVAIEIKMSESLSKVHE